MMKHKLLKLIFLFSIFTCALVHLSACSVITPVVEERFDDITFQQSFDFGGYRWRVLDRRDRQALLLSWDVHKLGYFHSGEYIVWSNSDIWQYLNHDFLYRFPDTDRERIVRRPVANISNPWFGTYAGMDTNDYVFLLSIDEVLHFLGDDIGQLEYMQEHAFQITNDRNVNRIAAYGGRSIRWWLRTPAQNRRNASFVCNDGRIWLSSVDPQLGGPDAISNLRAIYGIRPAMWIQLDYYYEAVNIIAARLALIICGFIFLLFCTLKIFESHLHIAIVFLGFAALSFFLLFSPFLISPPFWIEVGVCVIYIFYTAVVIICPPGSGILSKKISSLSFSSWPNIFGDVRRLVAITGVIFMPIVAFVLRYATDIHRWAYEIPAATELLMTALLCCPILWFGLRVNSSKKWKKHMKMTVQCLTFVAHLIFFLAFGLITIQQRVF